ncbi:hypothetical protein B0H11DRAFT_2306439 [Mycena galericulata]|nr:hypothetical protein B0H11DRAFT_2306439 [Mycena galericulata]
MDRGDKLQLSFIVIGAGVAGLSCAIALRRIGQSVTPGRGVRMPPNLTKVLLHWGLKEKLDAISVKSKAIHVLLGGTGELMGTQVWDEELLKETRGEYLFAHLSDLIGLLYDEAIRKGADIRLGISAVSIDPATATITTNSSGILQADVIVGADGIAGLSRRILLQEEKADELADCPSIATIPKRAIVENLALKQLYEEAYTTLFCWLGDGRSAVGYPVGGAEDFSLCAYGKYDANCTLAEGVQEILNNMEPRLKNMYPLLTSLRRHSVMQRQPLENWVSASSRLVIIGTAAHPIPPGSIQESAMAVEDCAILARLFSYIRSHDQIPKILGAFQDIRQPRCAAAVESETSILHFTRMPDREDQRARDEGMRAKLAAVEVLQAGADEIETPEWREVKQIFAYDAEDEADDWWVSWGSLQLRSAGYHFERTNKQPC